MTECITLAEAEQFRICAVSNRKHAATVAESDPDAAFAWMAKADAQERQAAARLVLTDRPTLGVSGDLVPSEDAIGGYAARLLKSGNVTAVHTEAAVERIRLASDTQSFELAADAAESVQASDSVEQMLIQQAAALHKHGMLFLARCVDEPNTVERCRLANAAARLLNVSQEAILTLNKKRTGGTQTVLVQHVSVNEGAQALIGSLQTGGTARRVAREKKIG